VWGVIKQIVTGVKSIMGGVVDALIAPFKAAFNGIARAWNNTVGKFSFTVPSWVPGGLGGKGFSMPDIPYLADGGIVTGPTLAMIGEKGPEAVIPLTGRNAGVRWHYLHYDQHRCRPASCRQGVTELQPHYWGCTA
jgi:hypothetical protein